MALRVREFDNGWEKVMFSECPVCGHEFGKNDHRWKHFYQEHGPEDLGLSPIGERPEGVNQPMFTPIEELPGGEEE